jgi:hypothetical protein
MATTLAQAQETLHMLGVPRMTEEEQRAELTIHFALSQFDLMNKIGREVEIARQTAANKANFAKVVSDINILATTMETAPWFEANPNSLQLECLRDYVPDYFDDPRHSSHPRDDFFVIPELKCWDFTDLGIDIEWDENYSKGRCARAWEKDRKPRLDIDYQFEREEENLNW